MTRTWINGLCVGALCWALGCGDDDGKKSAEQMPPASAGCSAAMACAAGSVCLDGKCVEGEARGIIVPGNARGCELMLTDGSDVRVASVSFGSGVKGSFVRRAPRTGVSMIADGDHAIEETAASLVIAGSGDPAVSKVACVDSAGAPIANATVSFAD